MKLVGQSLSTIIKILDENSNNQYNENGVLVPLRYSKKVSFYLLSLSDELREVLTELIQVEKLLNKEIDEEEFSLRIFTDDY